MGVILTSPVEGLDVGDEYSGDREQWLVDEGYAKRKGNATKDVAPDGVTYEAKDDPTLASNRDDVPLETGPEFEARVAGGKKHPADVDRHGVGAAPTVGESASPFEAAVQRGTENGSVNENLREPEKPAAKKTAATKS